jgi:peptidoglycan/LPS O-acetylase OafA/YrhL
MQTIDQRLQVYKGIGPGFDFLRIGLAVSIVAFHSIVNLGFASVRQTPLWFAEYALVPMFFALSGFLVTGSAMRLSLKNFLINRGLRILPALAVDVTVCAIIIGPAMTTLPLSQYLTSTDFFKYFINFTGWIHYYLPGVFKHNYSPRVNGALWTVPFEMFCYFLMSLLILSRWVRYPLGVVAFIVFIMAVKFTLFHFGGRLSGDAYDPIPLSNLHATLAFVFNSKGTRLLITFLLGILFFQLKHRIPYSWPLFIACLFACSAAALGHDRTAVTQILSNDFVLLPRLVYMTCFLGVTPIPVPKFVHSGDYSYGVYLYHDPFLQLIINLFPGLVVGSLVGVPLLFLLGLTAVAVAATCSWHFVEKPILGLRKRFSFVARVRGVAGQTDAGVAPHLLTEALPTMDFPGNSATPESSRS